MSVLDRTQLIDHQVARNEYNEVIGEIYGPSSKAELERLKQILFSFVPEGWDVSVGPVGGTTCVNVSKNGDFCCTPCDSSLIENIAECIEFMQIYC